MSLHEVITGQCKLQGCIVLSPCFRQKVLDRQHTHTVHTVLALMLAVFQTVILVSCLVFTKIRHIEIWAKPKERLK